MTRPFVDYRTKQAGPLESLPLDLTLALRIRNASGWAFLNDGVTTIEEPRWVFKTVTFKGLGFEHRSPPPSQMEWWEENPDLIGNLPLCLSIKVGDDERFRFEWDNLDRLYLIAFVRGDWEDLVTATP